MEADEPLARSWPSPPPAPPAVEPLPPVPAFDAEPLPPDAPAGPEGFAVAPPPKPSDTVPGDRPIYTPPASGEETVAVEVPAPPPASPRPTKEDLAALDALLNPAEDGSAGAVDRPKAEKWEPQFRPGTTPPGRRVVGRRGDSSRNKLYAAIGGVTIILLGAAAAGYMFLGGPTEPTPVAAAPSPVRCRDAHAGSAAPAHPRARSDRRRCDPGRSTRGNPGGGRQE